MPTETTATARPGGFGEQDDKLPRVETPEECCQESALEESKSAEACIRLESFTTLELFGAVVFWLVTTVVSQRLKKAELERG